MAWEWVSPVCTGVAAVVSTAAVYWTSQRSREHAEVVADQSTNAAGEQLRRERAAQQRQADIGLLRTTTAELDARIDLVMDLYECVWWSLDKSAEGWGSQTAADLYHQRTLEAWVEYQRARAAARKIVPRDIDLAYGKVRLSLESIWVAIENWYWKNQEPTTTDVQALFDRARRAKEHTEASVKELLARETGWLPTST